MYRKIFEKWNIRNKDRQQEILILLFFPFQFVWFEIVLRGYSGVFASLSPVTAMLAACGTGVIADALICMIRKRSSLAAGILAALICAASALLFTVESMVRSVCATYMTPGNLLHGAGDVISNYTKEFARSLLPGAGRFLFFLLPAIILVWYSLRRYHKHTSLEADEAAAAKETKSPLPYLLYAAAGVLLIYCSVLASNNGRTARLYGSGYNYNAVVDAFGLVTATRLDLEYGLLGNPYESFSAEAAESSEAEPAGEDETEAAASGTTEAAAEDETDVVESSTVEAAADDETDVVESSTVEAAADDETDVVESSTTEAAADDETAVVDRSTTEAAENESAAAAENTASAESQNDEATAAENAAAEPPAYNVMNLDFSLPELHSTTALSQLTAYISARQPSLKNAYTGLFAGKNLIMVCAESYCDRFITPELTPTLWRLTHNGFYFKKYYQSEWGGSTTTGELAFTTGLCGNNGDDSFSDIADNNHYFTMGNQLQRLGYSSIAFHSGYYKYYKRHTTHENLGYNQFLGVGNGIEDIISYEYAPDSDLFENTIPLYIDHEPFSVYYMTLSGHAPYVSDSPLVEKYYDQVDAAFGDKYAKKTKYYICYQMELEAAMSLLVQRLEEAGIADDTVIVLTGDHYPYGLGKGSTWENDRDYIEDLLKTDDFFRWDQDRSGLIIWSGCLEHDLKEMACTVQEPVGNLDILPTLSNLFGVTFDSRLLPGRDVFAPNAEPMVFWNNFSVVVKEGEYDGRKLNWYPNEGYEWTADDPAFLEDLHDRVNDRLLMGRMIMKTDYYRLLFGEDKIKQAGDILWTGDADAGE